MLDTFSTIISARNIDLVQDIRTCDSGKELRVYTNGGHHYYSYTATMKILPLKVFHNRKYLSNILSFASVAHKYRITINT